MLTSNVFGLFAYLPAAYGLIPFLKKAVNLSGEAPDFLDDQGEAKYHFWPKTTGFRREPDLVVQFGAEIAINIECKYHSGKHNRFVEEQEEEVSNGDQLAEQYYDLLKGNLPFPVGSERYLFYVTKHFVLPTAELAESEALLAKLGCTGMADRMYWLSWRSLTETIRETLDQYEADLRHGERLALKDLQQLMTRKQLTAFGGFQVQPVPTRMRYFWRGNE
ncbi:hypothetical protein [Tumebacillus sp. BK434]|uniref:hypothetical protein n=1 Tax=Tumebacillus sp. BK434 TaxID=2512169 RepID=UPI00104ED482|nr:hypothetical protein [Tumebacillus sp. BK434]